MIAEDEDLLGPPVKRGRGRPPGVKNKPRVGPLSPHAIVHSHLRESASRLDKRLEDHRRERADDHGEASLNVTDVHSGVTVGWLAQVFGMDPTTIKKRLADCPPLYRRKAGYVYDLKVAAPYLVKPIFDVNKYLRGMKPSELPPQLTKEYWDAALKRQTWEERAGELWRTSAVMEVFSDTFLTMKSTMQLWTEDLERITGLSDEQRAELVKMIDSLQDEIHRKLVNMQGRRRTPSQRDEIEIDDPFAEASEEDLIG